MQSDDSSFNPNTHTKLMNFCIYLISSSYGVISFFPANTSLPLNTINVIPLANSRTSLQQFLSQTSYPYVFLNTPGQKVKLFRENRAAYRSRRYCLLCSSVARSGKDSTAETLSQPLLPCPMSNIFLLEAEKPLGLHSSSWIFKRISVVVQSESIGLVTRIADSVSCSLRAAAKDQCPGLKSGKFVDYKGP